MRFRKKPVEIEAIQWTGDNIHDVLEFCNSDERWKTGIISQNFGGPTIGHVPAMMMLDIPTLEGTMTASRGDWIIRGVRGELYPCKPDIFKETYDEVVE